MNESAIHTICSCGYDCNDLVVRQQSEMQNKANSIDVLNTIVSISSIASL